MPRRRRNDPAGVSDNPNLVTDPVRETEIVTEFRRKIDFLVESYRIEKRAGLDRKSFNESLARLKENVRRPHMDGIPQARLNPWLELAISMRARELAGLPPEATLASEHNSFVQQAARDVAKSAKALRGAPGYVMLRRYVEALMALIQEVTGIPVTAMRDKNSVYDPHLSGKGGEVIHRIVAIMEPGVSVSRLSYWVRDTRRKYAGKPMRFSDYFPGYGAKRDNATGSLLLTGGAWIQQIEIAASIYCP